MDEDPDVPEVRPPTIDDIRRMCRALDEAGARDVLIGGFAVILRGGVRTTKDIDLLVDPEPADVERLKRALSVLADAAARDIEAGELQKYTVVRVAGIALAFAFGLAAGVFPLPFVRLGEWLVGMPPTPFGVAEVAHSVAADPAQAVAAFGLVGLHAVLGWVAVMPIVVLVLYRILRPVLRTAREAA